MNIVIVGGGINGKYVSLELCQIGHDVTVIDRDFKVEELWSIANMRGYELSVIVGDGCEMKTLADADAQNADVLIACTGDDEDNLVISLLAKQEFGVPKVIARVNHPKNEWLFNDHWGIDRAVSPSHLLTSLVEEEVSRDKIVELLSFDDGRVELVETTLSEQSPLVGKTVSELNIPRECSLVAVVREGHVVFPRNETVISSGDELVLLSSRSVAGEVQEIFES
ncbi:MAG: TrkA family potassium uptake protein [Acidimicrobiia bacterium]